MIDIFQYFGTALGVISLITYTFWPKKMVLGMVLSSISCVSLVIWAQYVGAWGIMASQGVYVFLYGIAAWNWFNTKVGE